jgi:hypothetical protein
MLGERGDGVVDRLAERGPRRIARLELTAPVCRTCNNRWLSVLENDSKPILAPMVQGHELRLSAASQKLLATWAVKTTLMLDVSGERPIVPTGFFQSLRQQREASGFARVWVGAYKGPLAITVWQLPLRLGIDEDSQPNGLVTTMSLSHVVFQVICHFTRGGATVSDDRIYKDALALIWPPELSEPVVDWPPNRIAFDDEYLRILAGSISGTR